MKQNILDSIASDYFEEGESNSLEAVKPSITAEQLINLAVPAAEINVNKQLIADLEIFDFVKFLGNLYYYPERHELSVETVDLVLARGLKIIRDWDERSETTEQTRLVDFINLLDHAFQLSGEKLPVDVVTIFDKALLAFQRNYHSYSEECDKFWQFFGQNPQCFSPKILWQVFKEMNADPEVSHQWKVDATSALAYDLNFFISELDKIALCDQLRLGDNERFYEQLKLIKAVRTIQKFLRNFDRGEEASEKLDKILAENQKKFQDNIFLKSYLEKLLNSTGDRTVEYEKYFVPGNQAESGYLVDADFQPIGTVAADGISPEEIKFDQFAARSLARAKLLHTAFGINRLSPRFSGIFDRQNELEQLIDEETNQFVPVEQAINFSSGSEQPTLDDYLFRQRKILNFQVLSDPFFRELVNDYFKISLEELDLPVQFWFFDFIKDGNVEKFDKIKEFSSRFGADGMAAFLSLEFEKPGENNIWNIVKMFPSETAEEVFNKYHDIIREGLKLSEHSSEALKDFSQGMDIKKVLIGIVDRGKNLLTSIGKKSRVEEISQELKNIDATVVVLAGFFSDLKNNQNIDFKEIQELINNFQVKRKSLAEIADHEPELLRELKNILWENRKDDGEMGQEVMEKFDHKIDSRKGEFVVASFGGKDKVLAYVWFGPPEEITGEERKSKEATSLMVRKDLRGSGFATGVMFNILKNESINYVIRSQVHTDFPVAEEYLKKIGFNIEATSRRQKTGIPMFEIICRQELNEKLSSRQDDFSEKLKGMNLLTIDQALVAAEKNEPIIFTNLHPVVDIETIDQLLTAGYIITQLTIDRGDKDRRNIVLEKIKSINRDN